MGKKSLVYKLVLLSIAGLIGVGIIAFVLSNYKKPGVVPDPISELHPVSFVVRLEGNTVNVYECGTEGETYTKSLSEVNVFDLPEQVADNLRQGIEVENNAGLAKLVEAMSS